LGEQEPQGQQIHFELPKELAPGVYANYALVHHSTPHEITIDFCQLSTMPPTPEGIETIERIRQYVRDAGRDPKDFGMEARISLLDKTPDVWRQELEGWRQLEASHISVNTMKMGLGKPGDHIEAIRRFAEGFDIA
jgi:hypothetical protein